MSVVDGIQPISKGLNENLKPSSEDYKVYIAPVTLVYVDFYYLAILILVKVLFFH